MAPSATIPTGSPARSQSPNKSPVKQTLMETKPAEPSDEERGLKVYFGGLNFETTLDELKAFGEEAGPVAKVILIERSRVTGSAIVNRGYGFLVYATKDAAERAIRELNGRTLQEKTIRVELAVPHKRTPRAEEDGARGRRRRPRAPGAAADAAPAAAETAEAKAARRQPRPRREPRGEPEGENSETLLFVRNLPFKFSEGDLRGVFSDFRIVDAYISKFMGRPQGYGFIKAADNAEQQRILREVQVIQVNDRPLEVKIAKAVQEGNIARRRQAEAEHRQRRAARAAANRAAAPEGAAAVSVDV